MSEVKTYSITHLFHTSWEQLSPMKVAIIAGLQARMQELDKESIEYGRLLIEVLYTARKNKRLVAKINVDQAVDIYNDLQFLNHPWTYFPLKRLTTRHYLLSAPDERMHDRSFDHFIYADNEFTTYLALEQMRPGDKPNKVYLSRLAATLYTRPDIDIHFNPDTIEPRAALLEKSIQPWQQSLILHTYANIRKSITARCPVLFNAPPEGTEPPPEDNIKPIKPTGPMWLKLKYRLAETPAFQGYQVAARAPLYTALDYLEDLSKQKENAATAN